MVIQYIRSALFSFLVLPFLTLLICLFGLPFLFMKRQYFLKLARLWVHVIGFFERHLLGLHYEIRGVENLPKTNAFIIAAKHQSAYETFKLNTLFNDPAIILKKQLLSIPFWGWYLRKLDVIAIDRSSPKLAISSVRDGAVRAAAVGRPIVIFPQGTRVRPEVKPDQISYKPGVYRIQEATGLPIIPMALNSGVFWPKGSLLKKPGTIVLEFLPAIPPGLERQELMAKLEDVLETRSNRLAQDAQKELL